MTKKKYPLSVLIIAKNEEASIEQVVSKAVELLPKVSQKYEILINEDGSIDNTPKILDKISKRNKYIKVFHQTKSLGISQGFEFLYKKSANELVFTYPGDGQYSIDDLPRMVNKMEEGYDLVIGKRRKKVQYNALRKIISFCYNYLPEFLFKVDLYDAGSNKLYKKKVLNKTTPISKSVFNEAERIIRAYRLGFRVASIPINYHLRKKGKSSSTGLNLILNSTKDMIKFYFLKV